MDQVESLIFWRTSSGYERQAWRRTLQAIRELPETPEREEAGR